SSTCFTKWFRGWSVTRRTCSRSEKQLPLPSGEGGARSEAMRSGEGTRDQRFVVSALTRLRHPLPEGEGPLARLYFAYTLPGFTVRAVRPYSTEELIDAKSTDSRGFHSCCNILNRHRGSGAAATAGPSGTRIRTSEL